jgi:hypothetical protein
MNPNLFIKVESQLLNLDKSRTFGGVFHLIQACDFFIEFVTKRKLIWRLHKRKIKLVILRSFTWSTSRETHGFHSSTIGKGFMVQTRAL